MSQASHSSKKSDPLKEFIDLVSLSAVEVLWAIQSKNVPWPMFALSSAFAVGFHRMAFDYRLLQKFHLTYFYPVSFWPTFIYKCVLILFVPILWAIYMGLSRKRFIKNLEEAFLISNLKNALGRTPRFAYDHALDRDVRCITFKNVGLPKSDFDANKTRLEAALHLKIDEIKEHTQKGLIEITYTKKDLPKNVGIQDFSALRPNSYYIGETRKGLIVCDLRKTPHLLVAGLSGSGKSSFFRQMLTGLYSVNKSMEFVLVDLKEGAEFQLFEGKERVRFAYNVADAVTVLREALADMKSRYEHFKSVKVKDLDSYLIKKAKARGEKEKTHYKAISRTMIAVDEIADIFCVTSSVEISEAKEARAIIHEISRKGRAAGIHLALGTQRPDKRSLDTQVKANLSGALCFYMESDTSSLIVLDSARASKLPGFPGRAIWKAGSEVYEVQVPLLEFDDAETMLKVFPNIGPGTAASGPAINGSGPKPMEKIPLAAVAVATELMPPVESEPTPDREKN